MHTGRKWLVNQAHSTQSRKEGSEGEGEDAGYMVWLVAHSVKAHIRWFGISNKFPSFKVFIKFSEFKSTRMPNSKDLSVRVPKRHKRQTS